MEDHKKITIDSYNKTVEEYTKKVYTLHPSKESKTFLSLLPKNPLILDVGCGPGRDAKIFSDKGFKVIGIDLSENMIEKAESRVKNAEFKVMDALDLEFEDYYFDGIWSNAAFLHLPKKEVPIALKECYRVLKKNGIFYLSVKEGKGEILEPDKRYKGVKKFWSYFQLDEIKNYIEKAGFKILTSYIEKMGDNYSTHPWITVICRK